MDIEIAIPLGMKRIPDSVNQYSFRYETEVVYLGGSVARGSWE